MGDYNRQYGIPPHKGHIISMHLAKSIEGVFV